MQYDQRYADSYLSTCFSWMKRFSSDPSQQCVFTATTELLPTSTMPGTCLKAESLPVWPVDIPRKQLISREVKISQIFREIIHFSEIGSLRFLSSPCQLSCTILNLFRSLPHTPARADARILTGEWQKLLRATENIFPSIKAYLFWLEMDSWHFQHCACTMDTLYS